MVHLTLGAHQYQSETPLNGHLCVTYRLQHVLGLAFALHLTPVEMHLRWLLQRSPHHFGLQVAPSMVTARRTGLP